MPISDTIQKNKHSLARTVTSGASVIGLLFPVVFFTLPVQSSSAAAKGASCTLNSIGSFSNTVVDIVSDAAASSTSRLDYECASPTKYSSIQFCVYIQPIDIRTVDSQANNFYQTRNDDARLSWQMTLNGNGNETVAAYSPLKQTIGWTQYANWSADKINTLSSRQLTLRYLNRQRQDRVRSGSYNNTYQLITQYKFNNELKSSCSTGISNPDGTLITNFTVMATVTKNCQMENFQDIDFGTRDGLGVVSSNTSSLHAYGNIGIRCTYQTPYNISIDQGNNSADGIARLKSDNNFIPYQLFQKGCTTAWSNKSPLAGIGNTVKVVDNHQVCARILTPLTAAPAAGTYIDNVIVTATF